MRCKLQNSSALSCSTHGAYKRLNMELANEKQKVIEITDLNEQLSAHVSHITELKNKLSNDFDEFKKSMEIKENEMMTSMKNVEAQLQHKSDEYNSLFEQAEELRQMLEAKEALTAEKEAHMKRVAEEMAEQYSELQDQIAVTTNALKMKDESVKVIFL